MDTPDLGQLVQKALEEAMRERGHTNILIAGRTGVGKSTLINAVFQGKMAATGQGRPVTRDTREITKEGIPLSIFDTRGLEMEAFKETLSELEGLMKEKSRDSDAKRHIHVAWLCIQEGGDRVEDAEIQLHSMLAKYVPVVAVITKATADNGFRAIVQGLLPEARNVVRVMALPKKYDDGHISQAMGLEDLVELTSDLIPEGQKRAFAAAQKASISKKKNVSHGIVAASAASAALAGVSPIPFSDAFILVPIEVGMLAGITATFGLSLSKSFLTTLVSSAVGASGATLAGKTIVANLLKLIPGAGTAAGAAISAATAATLTTTIGEAYILTLASFFTESGGEPPSLEEVADEFRKRMLKTKSS